MTTTPSLDAIAGVAERPTRGPAASSGQREVAQLAQEFEAMLLLQMVRQMRQALLEEQHSSEGLGADTMTDTFDLEFTRYLSAVGGLGLTKALAAHLPGSGITAAGSEPLPDAAAAVGQTTPSAIATSSQAALLLTNSAAIDRTESRETAAALRLPLDAPISSAFGWRSDPFAGTQRFHSGIDLKAAYGQEVPTVVAGRVRFAGEQGGYGQTVVIEHDAGLLTRYAHLSSIAVSPGQELAAGEVVGRVGRSGRATGPHLHYEVSRDGTKLDPEELARISPDENLRRSTE